MSHVDCSRKDSHFRGRYHNFPMTFHKTVPKERIQAQSHIVDVKHSGCEFISFDSTYIFTHVALLDCHNIVMHAWSSLRPSAELLLVACRCFVMAIHWTVTTASSCRTSTSNLGDEYSYKKRHDRCAILRVVFSSTCNTSVNGSTSPRTRNKCCERFFIVLW
jgi:hypothetical protein